MLGVVQHSFTGEQMHRQVTYEEPAHLGEFRSEVIREFDATFDFQGLLSCATLQAILYFPDCFRPSLSRPNIPLLRNDFLSNLSKVSAVFGLYDCVVCTLARLMTLSNCTGLAALSSSIFLISSFQIL
jgi:hypothetical protein